MGESDLVQLLLTLDLCTSQLTMPRVLLVGGVPKGPGLLDIVLLDLDTRREDGGGVIDEVEDARVTPVASGA